MSRSCPARAPIGAALFPVVLAAVLAACGWTGESITASWASVTSSAPATPRPTCNPDLQPCQQLWVAFYTGTTNVDYVLEVGSAAYFVRGGGGVISLMGGDVAARVLALPSCEPIASFIAYPGSFHVARAASDGSVTVTNETGRLSPESGPGLVNSADTHC